MFAAYQVFNELVCVLIQDVTVTPCIGVKCVYYLTMGLDVCG